VPPFLKEKVMPNTVLISDYKKFCEAKIESLNESYAQQQLKVNEASQSEKLYELAFLIRLDYDRHDYKMEILRCDYQNSLCYDLIETGRFTHDFYLWFSSNKDKVEKVKYA
jgi:hypothetical protein